MRIGLNLLYLIPNVVGGMETYALELIDSLKSVKTEHEFFLFLNRESAELISDDTPRFNKIVCPVLAENRKKRYLFEQLKFRKYVKQYNIQLLHSLGYTAPIFLGCPQIVTIPDMAFKAFGYSMLLSRRLMLGFVARHAALHSKTVITISEFSRREILRYYKIPPEKVTVTYLAANIDEHRINTGIKGLCNADLTKLKEPYTIAFSGFNINKNIDRLIEAFLEARRMYKICQKLILIGHKPLGKGFEKYDGNPDIFWTGYIERSAVIQILRAADFLIFPSFYEGFGLPLLEAMAAGIPVVCSNTASLPEIAGDAGIYFDPYSVSDMAAKIAQVSANQTLRNDLRTRGFANLKRFSWRNTALDTVAAYNRVLKKVQSDVRSISRSQIESFIK